RIGASRSTRRRAISPCSHGSAALRAMRASAARAATRSTPRALRSLAAIARQYIEPMLATRWAPFDAALAAVDYAAPWDRLVTAFKFHDAFDLARPFARAIAVAERARGAPR